jgi:hypothetical protein
MPTAIQPDRVLTVNDYYDGPRLGIAELNGVPHIYEAEFDRSTDEYGDTYFLSPVDPGLLAFILEDWEIWSRWDAAFKRSEVTIESHPALDNERKRHEELKQAIGSRLKSDPANRRHFKGNFAVAKSEDGRKETIVKWEPV